MLSIPKDTKPLISNFIIFKCNWNLKIVNKVIIVCLITFTGYLQLDWRTDWRNGTVHPLQLTSKEAGRRRKSRNTHCNKNENVISDFHFLLLFFLYFFFCCFALKVSFSISVCRPPVWAFPQCLCLFWPAAPGDVVKWSSATMMMPSQRPRCSLSVSQSATLWVSVVRRKTRVSFGRGVTLTWR